MRRKLVNAAAALALAFGGLTAATVAAPPAQAATWLWADVYHEQGCYRGGYFAWTTGNASTATLNNLGNRTYPYFAGGDRYAHGAPMKTIKSVMVQPGAQWEGFYKISSSISLYTATNKTSTAKCYNVPQYEYVAMNLRGA